MTEWRTSKKKAGKRKAGKRKAAGEKSAGRKSAGKKSAGKKSAGKKSAGKKSAGKKNAVGNEEVADAKAGTAKAADEKQANAKKASGKKKSSKNETSGRRSASKEKTSGKKKAAGKKKTSGKAKASSKKTAAGKRKASGKAKAPSKKTAPGKKKAADVRTDPALRLLPSPTEPLPSNVLPLFPDFQPDREWVLGVFSVTDSGVDANAVVVVEAGSRHVVHLEVLDSTAPELLVQTVHGCIDRCPELGLEPPTRIRVASSEHADLLQRGGLGEITTVTGPTPELDGLWQGLLAGEHDGLEVEDDDRYRGSADVTDEHLRAFFAAAQSFGGTKPWRVLDVDALLVFQIEELGIEQGMISVLGLGGEGGLMIIPDVSGITEVEPLELVGGRDLPARSLAVTLVKRAELSKGRAQELKTMPFAPRRGSCPVLTVMEHEQRSRAATGADYELATAVMSAVGALVSDYGSVLRCSSLRSLTACYPMALGGGPTVDVYIGVPEEEPEEGLEPGTDDDATFGGDFVIELPPMIAPHMACRLRISLYGSKPPVWRKVEVPADITLGALHEVIQAVMGWGDCHLHEFVLDGRRFGPDYGDFYDREVHDEHDVALGDVVGPGSTFEYVYDFGDHWDHRIRVEDIYEPASPMSRPRCTGGRRACPPEDSGGMPGYAHALEVLSTVAGAELPEMLTAYEGFDPKAFDRAEADAVLGRIFGKP